MNLFDLYADPAKHNQLTDIFTIAAQQHPDGLAANFIEKDIWVTEILRLLYDEALLGSASVAFKGGTALSKCWASIARFSEDIDLSIHWADLSGLTPEQEQQAWQTSVQSNSQVKKFRENQAKAVQQWSEAFVQRLNTRLKQYNIAGLYAEIEPGSKGEKVDVHFPRTTKGNNDYQLDHVLLEFGGRNRGKPNQNCQLTSYLSECPVFAGLSLPQENVTAFDKDYILWEKLTALHQFCTQQKPINPNRLARHWYDVDCLLQNNFADPLTSNTAMSDVIEMKKHRWSEKGVDYEQILTGGLVLIPSDERLTAIAQDHQDAIQGQMFFKQADSFDQIIQRLTVVQGSFNQSRNPT